MRNLFHILLAAVAFFASCGYSATESQSVALAFYVVSEEKIDGGRYIDTLDLPKVGYIAVKPDLVITRLVAVSESVAHSSMVEVGKDGKRTETPFDQPALTIQIFPADTQKIESLTGQNIGKRVLMMVGDTPLIAPAVQAPISTQSFQITIGKQSDQKVIEDALKKLVH